MISHVAAARPLRKNHHRKKSNNDLTKLAESKAAEHGTGLDDILFDAHIPLTETAYSGASKSKDKHVNFVIDITERHTWQVRQRYSAFEALHKALLKGFPAKALPELPPKRFLRSFDRDYLRKKQSNLEKYLRALVKVPGVMRHPAMQAFTAFDHYSRLAAPAPAAPSPSPTPPSESPVVSSPAAPTVATPPVPSVPSVKAAGDAGGGAPVPPTKDDAGAGGGRTPPATRNSDTALQQLVPSSDGSQVPKRVSTAVCRSAAMRAKTGTALGDGLHVRSLLEFKADPTLKRLVGTHRVHFAPWYDDWDDIRDAVATHGKLVATFPGTGAKLLLTAAQVSARGESSHVVKGVATLNGHRCRVVCDVSPASLHGSASITSAPPPASSVQGSALDELSSIV